MYSENEGVITRLETLVKTSANLLAKKEDLDDSDIKLLRDMAIEIARHVKEHISKISTLDGDKKQQLENISAYIEKINNDSVIFEKEHVFELFSKFQVMANDKSNKEEKLLYEAIVVALDASSMVHEYGISLKEQPEVQNMIDNAKKQLAEITSNGHDPILKEISKVPGLIEIFSPEILTYVYKQIVNNENDIAMNFANGHNFYEIIKSDEEEARTFKIVKDTQNQFHIFVSLKSKRSDRSKFDENESVPIAGTEKERHIALDIANGKLTLYAELAPKNKDAGLVANDNDRMEKKKKLEQDGVITPEILVPVSREGGTKNYTVRYSPYKPKTLDEALQHNKLNTENIDFEARMAVFMKILHGVKALHAEGIAHLDLKPENINIGTQGDLTISDIDYHRIGDNYTESKRATTENYLAPEIIAPFTFIQIRETTLDLEDQDDKDTIAEFTCDIMKETYAYQAITSGPETEGKPEKFKNYIIEGIDKELVPTAKTKINEKADVWSLGILLLEFVKGMRYKDLQPVNLNEVSPPKISEILKGMLDPNPKTRWDLNKVSKEFLAIPNLLNDIKIDELSAKTLSTLLFPNNVNANDRLDSFIATITEMQHGEGKPTQESLDFMAQYLQVDVTTITNKLNLASSTYVTTQEPHKVQSEQEWRKNAKTQLLDLCVEYIKSKPSTNKSSIPSKSWNLTNFSHARINAEDRPPFDYLLNKIKELAMRIESSDKVTDSFSSNYRIKPPKR